MIPVCPPGMHSQIGSHDMPIMSPHHIWQVCVSIVGEPAVHDLTWELGARRPRRGRYNVAVTRPVIYSQTVCHRVVVQTNWATVPKFIHFPYIELWILLIRLRSKTHFQTMP
jgi:hypothetical protein